MRSLAKFCHSTYSKYLLQCWATVQSLWHEKMKFSLEFLKVKRFPQRTWPTVVLIMPVLSVSNVHRGAPAGRSTVDSAILGRATMAEIHLRQWKSILITAYVASHADGCIGIWNHTKIKNIVRGMNTDIIVKSWDHNYALHLDQDITYSFAYLNWYLTSTTHDKYHFSCR